MRAAHRFARLLGTLRVRLILALMLIAVLPLGFVGLGGAALNRAAIAEQSARELTGLARGLASQVDASFSLIQDDARLIAALPGITNGDASEREQLLKEIYHQYPKFSRLAIFDLNGQRIASATPSSAVDIGSQPAFREAVQQHRQAWQLTSGAGGNGRSSLVILTPIRSTGSEVTAVLCTMVDLAQFSSTTERVMIGEGGHTYVLDAQGRIVLHPDERLVQERADFSGVGLPLGGSAAGPGVLRFEMDGEARIAGYAPVSTTGWLMVVERPEREVLAPAQQSAQLALAVWALTTAAAIITTLAAAHWLTRRLGEVTTAARALASGEASVPLPEVPAHDEVGILVSAFTQMRDAVTQREQRLRESEERFRRLAENAPDIIFRYRLTAPSGFEYVSPAIQTIAGYQPEQCYSDPKFARRVFEEGDLQALRAAVTSNSHQPGGPLVVRFRRSDGTTGWAEIRFVPVVAGNGKVAAVEGIARDVTNRRNAETERLRLLRREQEARAVAERAVRVRDEFLAVAAHELKTPITSLRGFAQLAIRRLNRGERLEPEELQRTLQIIDLQSSKLSRLIEQLLDVTRIEAGKLRIDPAPTDLAGMLRRVVSELQSRSPDHELVIEVPPTLEAFIDPLRIEQVIVNLLENAVKYSPGGGRVDLMARVVSGAVEVSVRDRGIGIPPDRRAHLFNRFYQAHGDGHLGGMGLGLYISQQIVELHGGRIRADFPDSGGTEFVVTLPARTHGSEGSRSIARDHASSV